MDMEVSPTTIATASKRAKIPREKQKTPSLPTEIITDIFSRLPAKFVFQMECLSKYYSSSLSRDPYFVEAHFRQSSRLRPSLIVQKPHGVVSLIRSDGDKVTVEKRPVGFLKDHQIVLQDRLPLELDDDSEEEERIYQCFLYDFDTEKTEQIPDLFAYNREEVHYNFTENLAALLA